jgi:N-acetylmuramoyl-L-alanine amidase
MRKINEIIVHCTATPEGRHVTVADVDNWHRARTFNGIGYHYLIYLDGSIHQGRPIERIGAHCKQGGHNRYSIGVCYVGGLAKDCKTTKDTRTLLSKRPLGVATAPHSQCAISSG